VRVVLCEQSSLLRILISETTLVVINAVAYYLPHYILRIFLSYLEKDSERSNPAWGWLLAFGLFMSNTAISILNGVIFSLSTTTLQAGIRLQLNTLLFSKTLAKKDIAAAAELKEQSAGQEVNETDKEKTNGKQKEEDDDEGVSSKTQIMTLFTVDVDRVTEFVWHQYALVDAPIEIVVATIFLVQLLGSSAAFGLLAALRKQISGGCQLIPVCLPLNHIAAKVVVTAQENLMKARDSRTALMNEILQGIRMLK
jgi:ABC-type multidrug transport system fused ATPase/permease subunit